MTAVHARIKLLKEEKLDFPATLQKFAFDAYQVELGIRRNRKGALPWAKMAYEQAILCCRSDGAELKKYEQNYKNLR